MKAEDGRISPITDAPALIPDSKRMRCVIDNL